MKKFALFLSMSALVAMSSVANAGGPVRISDEGQPVMIVGKTPKSGGAGVVAAVVVAALFAISGSSGSHGSNID